MLCPERLNSIEGYTPYGVELKDGGKGVPRTAGGLCQAVDKMVQASLLGCA